MIRASIVLAGLGVLASAAPALAQAAGPVNDGSFPADEDQEAIVVTAGKPEGSVRGDIAPELTLTPGDIRSYGVSSLSDLIAELSPQTTSGQGRGGESSVVLLNGKRISSFSEIRDIPTEAIQRVEILPEEVALKYGYRANQKVVNIVLRRRFNAFTAELEGSMPTEGGQFSSEIQSSYLHIGDFGRLNVALKYEGSSSLYESERDLIQQSPRQPYDVTGNITSAISGAEIDPALSALLGRPATVVGVPASAATGAPVLGDFMPGAVNVADVGQYRTLLPKTDALSLNAVLARTIFDNVSASFNATLDYNESNSKQGLATAQFGLPSANPYSPFAGDVLLYRYLGEYGPLAQRSRDITGHLGMTLNGALGGWQWSLTGGFDHAVSRTANDRGFDLSGVQARLDALDPLFNPFAPLGLDDVSGVLTDRARSTSNVGNLDLMFSGSLLDLPAGAVTTTLEIKGITSDFSTRSTRSGILSRADLSRDTASGQFSLDLPIASRKNDMLSALGDLSINLNFAYDQLSDFGGLATYGFGVNWKPAKPIELIASVTKDEGAPTVQQLGNPLVATSGIRVFDYVRGETIDITRLSGGNASLAADDRRLIKLGLTVKPFTRTDLTLTANYTNSRIDDPIASFPTATAALEAAFPQRFLRDADGQLVQIDARPINFARQNQEQIRWGINFSKQLWTPPRPAAAAGGQGQPPPLREMLPPGQGHSQQQRSAERSEGSASAGSGNGPGAGRPPGGGFGRGPGGRGTRLQLALYHTIYLRDEILIHEGGPALDLLHGDAIGSSGGQPRHEVQAQAGLVHNGLGARLSAAWQSGTTVDGGPGGSLRFSDLATLNLRLFANLGQQQALTSKWPFLRGTRLSLSVTNIFNSRLSVRDANGVTPISYQPAYLDPLGRSVRLSFRKLFF